MNAKEYLEEYKTLKGNAEEMQQTYDYLISRAEYRNSVIDGMPRSQSHENTQENIIVQVSATKDKLDDLNLRAEKAKKDITSSMKDKGLITQTELEEIKQYLVERYHPLIE